MVALFSLAVFFLLVVLKAALDTIGIDSSGLVPQNVIIMMGLFGYLFWRGTAVLDALSELGGFSPEYLEEHNTEMTLYVLGGIGSEIGFIAAPLLVIGGYLFWGIVLYLVMIVVTNIFITWIAIMTKASFRDTLDMFAALL